jgi:hypothetical protein
VVGGGDVADAIIGAVVVVVVVLQPHLCNNSFVSLVCAAG